MTLPFFINRNITNMDPIYLTHKIVYTGENKTPIHSVHKKYKTLLTKDKIYLCEPPVEYSGGYYSVTILDDRNAIGTYELKDDEFKSIDEYRNDKIDKILQ